MPPGVAREVGLLKQRVITAVFMLLLLYVVTAWFPVPWFAAFLTLLYIPALLEWSLFMGLRKGLHRLGFVIGFLATLLLSVLVIGIPAQGVVPREGPLILLCALALVYWLFMFGMIRHYPDRTALWDSPQRIALMAVPTLLPTWWALVYLKTLSGPGWLVFSLIALVSVADIGAYFSGRRWGRRKLAPRLSPGKSWEGVWGGMTASLAVAAALAAIVHLNVQALDLLQWILLLLAALLVAAVSVMGDLFESMLKRQRGMKDSGRCLPGHGGLLDRADSLLAAAPVFALAVLLIRGLTGDA